MEGKTADLVVAAPLKDCTELVLSVSGFYLKLRHSWSDYLHVYVHPVWTILKYFALTKTFLNLAFWLAVSFTVAPSRVPLSAFCGAGGAVLNWRHPEGTTSWHQLQWFQNNFFAPPWNKNSGFSSACIDVKFFKGLFPDHNFSFLTRF